MNGTIKFPAMKGRMGANDYYVAMFPLKWVPQVFHFVDGAQMPAEVRAQRKLNTKRVPEIARYILDHEEDWLFSSLTASFDAEAHFVTAKDNPSIGTLELPLGTKFLINDGQHRLAAIREALATDPSLGEQSISVVLFEVPIDNIERNQQMFSDLNRTVQKTSRSLDILYDHRDPLNLITLAVAAAVPFFRGRVEKDAVSLAARSPRVVTLSSLYDANRQLLGSVREDAGEDVESSLEKVATKYWQVVSECMREWKQVQSDELRPSELRMEYVNGHSVTFWALGAVGKVVRSMYPNEEDWATVLGKLRDIDWRRTNPEWQGICMIGRDILTRRQTREATAAFIEWKLGLTDAPPEPVLEVLP